MTILRHIENTGIVRTDSSGIFMDVQECSAMFRHTEKYEGISRQIEQI